MAKSNHSRVRCSTLKPMRAAKRSKRNKRSGWFVKLWMLSARASARSMSERPLVGSSSNPREAGFKEMAMAFSEKSRRRKSSIIVDQRISGRVPGRT